MFRAIVVMYTYASAVYRALPKFMNGVVKSTALFLSAVIVRSVIAKSASFKMK